MDLATAEFSDRVESCGWRTCVVTFPGHPPVLLWHDDVEGLSEDAIVELAAERIDQPVPEDEQRDYEWTLLKHGMNPDGSEADEMLVNSVLRAGGNGGQIPDVGELSIEQMCRNLLQYAIHEGLVAPVDHEDLGDDPQGYPHGEPTGMANVLASYFRDKPRK